MMTNKYFKTDKWEPVCLATKKQRDQGRTGGEGCQWVIYITCDKEDGQLAFFGTDVGGMYKSTDGGHNWTSATTGMECCAATGIEIDPANKNHVVAVGCNSYGNHRNGVYVSWDAGETWKAACCRNYCGYRDTRKQIAFDPTTYDKTLGGSAVVYWSREEKSNRGVVHPAFYKSTDGGNTWTEFPDSAYLAESNLVVDPVRGWLYAASSRGLFRSKDKAATFEQLTDKHIKAIDIIDKYPDNLYMLTYDGLMLSTDCGESFTELKGEGFEEIEEPRYLRVSPVNPDDMVLQDDRLDKGAKQTDYANQDYYTHDGGKTWHKAKLDTSDSIVPYNANQHPHVWLPDGKSVLTLGGDFITRSDDRGETYHMSNDGYNGHCTGGTVGVNMFNPDLIAIGSQDYNGFFSIDGGYSWKYVNWSGCDWGGMNYGSYCFDENTVVVGGSPKGWIGRQLGAELEIYRTCDGGKTVEHTGYKFSGIKAAYSVPGEPDSCIMGNAKTTDRGKTWRTISEIDGVEWVDFEKGYIFGVKNGSIMLSEDGGEMWKKICHFEVRPTSLCYVPQRNQLVIASDRRAFRYDMTADIVDEIKLEEIDCVQVLVDPDDPDVYYSFHMSNAWYGGKGVLRSLDCGKSWTQLTRGEGSGMTGLDAGRQCCYAFIHPTTKELWVVESCRGLWKMKLPKSYK